MRLVDGTSSEFGDHTQRTLVAPLARNRSCTCRQAATYWAGVPPLTPPDHGYQLPFISCMKRRWKGLP
jgi:hypothetical protein